MGRPLEMDVLDPMSSPGCEHVHSEEKILQRNATSNWYFPLHFQTIGDPSYHCTSISDPHEDPNLRWLWRGIHHLSPNHLKLKYLSLPSFNLPLDWVRQCNPLNDIIASIHGLLLLKLETCKVLEMDALRCPLDNDDLDLTRWCHLEFLSSLETGHEACGERWTPLMVYNPLSKEWKILPAMSPHEMGMAVWDYRFVQAHLVVDEVENSYQVLLVFLQSMCVYNSREKTWRCHRFERKLEWGSWYRGLQQVQSVAWRYQGASVCIHGRVVLVDLTISESTAYEREPLTDGALILYYGHLLLYGYVEDWKEVTNIGLFPISHLCSPNILDELHQDGGEEVERDGDEIQDRTEDPWQNPGFGRCSYSLEILECMNNVFAIIPALLVQNWMIRDPHNNLVCMPLQFHIFWLRFNEVGGLLDQDLQRKAHGIHRHGVLRIQIPRTQGFIDCKCDDCYFKFMDPQCPHKTSALWCRHEILYRDAMKSYKSRLNKNWFRCTARGSVIWVSVHEYMLQYDVVSRESKMEMVLDLFDRNEEFCGAVCEYTPNFHMKP